MMYLFAWQTRDLKAVQLPAQIEALEAESRTPWLRRWSSSDYHKRDGELMRVDAARAVEIERLLEAAFERWAELEQRRSIQR